MKQHSKEVAKGHVFGERGTNNMRLNIKKRIKDKFYLCVKQQKLNGALELAQWNVQGTLAKRVHSIAYRAIRSAVIGAMLCSSLLVWLRSLYSPIASTLLFFLVPGFHELLCSS